MDYLPKDATIEEACNWLQAKTGQTWVLARLLECHLRPHFWLDYKPGYPTIYGDRIEGYQTRMIFQGDLCRLESDRGDALVNMFTAHDGTLVKVQPGLRVPLSELKFKRESVERVAEIINKAAQPLAATPAPVAKETPAERRPGGLTCLKPRKSEKSEGHCSDSQTVKALTAPTWARTLPRHGQNVTHKGGPVGGLRNLCKTANAKADLPGTYPD